LLCQFSCHQDLHHHQSFKEAPAYIIPASISSTQGRIYQETRGASTGFAQSGRQLQGLTSRELLVEGIHNSPPISPDRVPRRIPATTTKRQSDPPSRKTRSENRARTWTPRHRTREFEFNRSSSAHEFTASISRKNISSSRSRKACEFRRTPFLRPQQTIQRRWKRQPGRRRRDH